MFVVLKQIVGVMSVPDTRRVSMECDLGPHFCVRVQAGPSPSYMEGVVVQVAQQRLGDRQLVGAAGVSVDGKACQVLQRGERLRPVQGAHQLQRDLAVFSCIPGWIGPGFGAYVTGRRAWTHVVLYEAENIGEGLQVRQPRRDAV